MCGIGVSIEPEIDQQDQSHSRATPALQSSWPSILQNIRNRGPDCLETLQHAFHVNGLASSSSAPWTLSLTSSVLSLRGDGVTKQPLSSSDVRLMLAWNGQIFDWDDTEASRACSSRVRLDACENDAIILLDRIQHLLGKQRHDGSGSCSTQEALNMALSEVEGPYALVLLDRVESKLYYGRDPLGRRSLLLHRSPQHSSLAIISVAGGDVSSSIEQSGTPSEALLTEIDCSSLWTIDLLQSPISPLPLPRVTSRFTSPLLLRELRPPEQPSDDHRPEDIRQAFLAVLSESVRRRVTNINTDQPANEAHVAVLFSGGLDCTTLALLTDRYVPKEQPIDLLNVGFENVRAIEAATLEREKRVRSKLKAATKGKKHGHDPSSTEESATQLNDVPQEQVSNTNTAIEDDIYAVPDRLTGLSSYAELCQLCPNRRWNFVCINIPYSEYTAHRTTVSSLMSPTSSVMDLSIGSALYFASRARGHVHASTNLYTSPARVLISGLGADELLGGYSRHRQAYHRHSLAGLIQELQLDLDRLPTRNLGRDDRILSAHGKESRYPFLDRHVLDFLTSIPVRNKVDLERIAIEGAGGDKRLLRDLAKSLGLERASGLKKRAMQFGTRSAKIDAESRHVKGHHRVN